MIGVPNFFLYFWLFGIIGPLSCPVVNGGLFDNVTFVNDTGCMFFLGRINIVNTDSKKVVTLPPTPSDKTVACQQSESSLHLTYNNVDDFQQLTLSFRFIKDSRNWMPASVNVSVKCNTKPQICANVDAGYLQLDWLTSPSNMSYKCTNTYVSSIITSTKPTVPLGIQFYWLQFQPFDTVDGRFHRAVDCEGLFTVPIWSILLVSFLLIGILSYGLVMLSAVQPNALYDDPKSKMVQLGANN